MHRKTLKPFKKFLFKRWVYDNFPEYMNFVDEILDFMETLNSLEWFDGDTAGQKDNSIYQNVVEFRKHHTISELPVENIELLDAYMKDFASTLDYRNRYLDLDLEVLRDLAHNANMIYSKKGSWTAYNFLFATMFEYVSFGYHQTITFSAFFTKAQDFPTEQPPSYEDMSEDDIVLADYPYYELVKRSGSYEVTRRLRVEVGAGEASTFSVGETVSLAVGDNAEIVSIDVANEYLFLRYAVGNFAAGATISSLTGSGTIVSTIVAMSEEYAGSKPYEYQIVTKNDIMGTGNFSRKLQESFTPAGFNCGIMYFIDEIIFQKTITSESFLKRVFEVDSPYYA